MVALSTMNTAEEHPRGDLRSPEGRLAFLLRGRKPFVWNRAVRLSNGAVQRMKEGKWPDPAKLVPACRIENASLTWLLEGRGTPYLVHVASTEDQAIEHTRALLEDAPDLSRLIVYSALGACFVLHEPREGLDEKGEAYRYTAMEVITGVPASAPLAAAFRSAGTGKIEALRIPDDAWRRLASGWMGTAELFGSEDEKGLAVAAKAISLPELEQQLPANGTGLGDEERRVIQALRGLGPAEREMVLRMLGVQK